MTHYYIDESNMSYYLVRGNYVFVQEVEDSALMVRMTESAVQIRIEHDGRVASADLPTKCDCIALFEQDKKEGILLTSKSDYRSFIRSICGSVQALSRRENMPFLGVNAL